MTNIMIFEMKNTNETIKANNFKFNFVIEGRLNKDFGKIYSIQKKSDLLEVENKAKCLFTSS